MDWYIHAKSANWYHFPLLLLLLLLLPPSLAPSPPPRPTTKEEEDTSQKKDSITPTYKTDSMNFSYERNRNALANHAMLKRVFLINSIVFLVFSLQDIEEEEEEDKEEEADINPPSSRNCFVSGSKPFFP
jgi:hypothetical protein